MFDQNAPQEGTTDYNEAAAYAAQYTQLGGKLNLGPSIQDDGAGSFELSKPETDDDVVKFYEQNPNLYLDLSQPDAEQTWHSLVRGMKGRHNDIFETLKEAGSAIAEIPVTLAEGIAESKDLRTLTASTIEGAARGLRDMYGMMAQSENPTSLLFNFKSAIKAITSGKPSQNWQEEAQQWNEARKFLYGSYKMAEGDETLLDQFDFLNSSNEAKERWRSFVNPKIAHAMAFMGLEIPSILAAPFTAGATGQAALAAGIMQGANAARAQARANWLMRTGNALARHQANFENMASRFSQRLVGNVTHGLGSALEPIANVAEGAIGGTIRNLSERSGMAEGAINNVAQGLAAKGVEAVGAGQIRQTVGFLGSMGLRSTSELLKEIGDANLNLANGMVSLRDVTGLTVLERVAGNEALSGSARMAAKFLNVTVDPLVQMSTAALKNGYKDSLIFAGLGFANDNLRGAAGGAAMGMVWGGYSGAFRHTWSAVTGGMQHGIQIKHFDENVMPIIENSSQTFANSSRTILSEIDKLKSTRISSNTRVALQVAFASMSKADRENVVFHFGNRESLKAELASRSIILDDGRFEATAGGRAAFGLFYRKGVNDSSMVPVLFVDKLSYRPVDVGHEIMAHVVSHNLHAKGMLGDFHRQMLGTKENGGVFGNDEVLLDSVVRRVLAEQAHLEEYQKAFIEQDGAAKSVSDINTNPAVAKRYIAWYEKFVKDNDMYRSEMTNQREYLKDYRAEAERMGDVFWNGGFKDASGKYVRWIDRPMGENSNPEARANKALRYLFEENVAQYSEALFLHTNLADLTKNASAPVRLAIESLRTNMFAKQLNQMELAGIQARREGTVLDKSGNPVINAYVYDNGKFYRSPEMDGLVRRMVRTAMDLDGQSIEKMSPQRMAMEARRFGKEYLFNMGGVQANMLSVKQRNELLTKRAEQSIKVLEALDPKNRPPIEIDEFGNKSVDMYKMSDEAYAALVEAGSLDKHAAETAKAWRDAMLKWEESGYVSGNVFSGEYLGDSHRTTKDGWFRRIFKPDTPVTHRMFVPYELRLAYKITREDGTALRAPKGHMLATVLDANALFRRQLNNWAKPEVQALFKDLSHFRNTFQDYLMNMMKEPSARVPSADLFRKEFGNDAEKVRNVMFETFGARKRADEAYTNAPREGYRSNPEDPNYPIHSMRLEYLIGAEKMPSTPIPFNIRTSYEPLRTNKSVAGFTVVNQEGTRRRNGQGFEIFSGRSRHKLYSPYGEPIGVFDSIKKAVKASNKYLGRMDEADVMPMPMEVESLTKSSEANAFEALSDKSAIQSAWNGGVMKSVVGWGRDGNPRIHEMSFMDNIYDIITKSYARWFIDGKVDTNRTNYSELSVGDLMTAEQKRALRKFCEECGIKNNFEDMRIVPSLGREHAIDNHKHARGVYEYETDARAYVITDSLRTNGLDMAIDMNFVNMISNGDSALASKFLESIIKKELLRRSLSYSVFGEEFSGHSKSISIVKASELKHAEFLEKFIKEWGTGKPTEQQVDAIKKFRNELNSQIAKQLNDNTYVIKNGKSVFDQIGKGWVDEIGNVKLLNEWFPETAPENFAKDLKKLPASKTLADFDAALTKFANDVIGSKDIDVIAIPDPTTGSPYGSIALRGSAIVQSLRNIDGLIQLAAKEHAYVGYIAGKMANKRLHGLFQIVGKTMEGKSAALEAINHGDVAGRVTYGKQTLISAEFTARQIANVDEVIAIYTETAGDKSLRSRTSSGFITIYHPELKNSIWGGSAGAGEGAPRQTSNPVKNLSARTAFGSGLPISAFDNVIRNRANGNIARYERFVSEGNHIAALKALSLGLLEKNFDQGSMTGEAFALEVAKSALKENNDAVMHFALAVAQVEKIFNDAKFQKELRFSDKPDMQKSLLKYAQDQALGELRAAIQDYFALPTTNHSKTLDSVYSLREGRMLADGIESTKTLFGIELKKALFSQSKGLMNKVEPSVIFKSVASIDGFTEDVKNELITKGWLKTNRYAGRELHTFEFSDKDAALNLSLVQGEQHLLPWVEHPSAGKEYLVSDLHDNFEAYQNAILDNAANGITTYSKRPAFPFATPFGVPQAGHLTQSTTLGKIFSHPELYKYFPELKDVPVYWADFYGAYFRPSMMQGSGSKNVGSITLGIRSCCGFKMSEQAAMSGVPEGNTAFANSYRGTNSYRSRFASQNPFASMILHEVQHWLQFRTNIETPHYRILGKVNEAKRKAFSDTLGVWEVFPEGVGETPDQVLGITKEGFVDFGNLENNMPQRVLASPEVVSAIANSPFFKSINGRAGHLVRKAYLTMHSFLAEELDAKRLDPSYVDRLEKLNTASLTATMGGDGMLNFYNQLVDLHDSLTVDSANFRSNFPMHDEFYMTKHAIGFITDVDLLDVSDPVHFAATVRSMTDALAHMDYNLAPHERMARETERRSGMTQQELLASPRESMNDPKVLTESKSGDSIVDIVNTAIQAGEKESGAFYNVMRSIGGIGEVSSQDSAVLTGLGKLSLLNVHVHKAWHAIDAAKAVAVAATGWFVDTDGKVRLKNGRYILRGKDYNEISDKLSEKGVARRLDPSESMVPITAINESYVQGSYSIEDLANLADVVVESRMETTVGNELIDAVLSPAFPSVIKGDEFMGELAKIYVPSEDAAYAANLLAISDVLKGQPDIVLTKNDLANMIVFYHRTFSDTFEQTGINANVYAKGAKDIKLDAIPRDRKIAALVAETNSRVTEDAVRHATGIPNASGFFVNTHDQNSQRLTAKYGFGRFQVNATKISFTIGTPPDWVSQLGQDAVEKWMEKSKSITDKLIGRMAQRVFTSADEASNHADRMNARISNKLLLLEPVLDSAIERIKNDSEQGTPADRVEFAMSLLDEMGRSQERIAFGTLARESVKRQSETRIFESPTYPITGNSISETGVARIQKQLGGLRAGLNTTGFGDIGSSNLARHGHDPFSSYGNKFENESATTERPIGMLSFIAGSVLNLDYAEGVSTSSSVSGYGVSAIQPRNFNPDIYSTGWNKNARSSPALGTASDAIRDVAAYDMYNNGQVFWGGLSGLVENMKEVLRFKKDMRVKLTESLEKYIAEYEQYLPSDEGVAKERSADKFRKRAQEIASSEEEKASLVRVLENMDILEAKRLLTQIDLEDASIPREHLILDLFAEIASKKSLLGRPSVLSGVDSSMPLTSPSRKYYQNNAQPIFPVLGTQAASIDGVAVFNVAHFTADASAQDTYKVRGGFGSSVPAIVRSRFTNAMHSSDIALYNGLFANVINNTADGTSLERFSNVNVDRLSVLHDVAEQLAEFGTIRPNDVFTISKTTHADLGHTIGGSFLALYSLVLEAASKEQLSVRDYATRFPLIQQISEGTPYAEVIPSPVANLSRKIESGEQHHSSLLGVAAALPLAAVLNRGYLGWNRDGVLMMTVPNAVRSPEFIKAVEIARATKQGGTKALLYNMEFAGAVQGFIEKLTSEDVSRLALECTSHANAATVSNMMAFLNTWGLTKEQTPRTVGNANIGDALSAGLASGAMYLLGGHAASGEKAGLSKESIGRLNEVFKEALKHESFWVGYFAAHHGMEKGDFRLPIPTPNGVNDGASNVYTRSSITDSRAVGYVHGVFPKSRFSVEGGHPIDAESTFALEGISVTPRGASRRNVTDQFEWSNYRPKPRDLNVTEGESFGIGVSFAGTFTYEDAIDYGSRLSHKDGNTDTHNSKSFFRHVENNLTFDEVSGLYEISSYNDRTSENERVMRSEQPSGDVSSRQVVAQHKEFSRGLRRKIMTNMITNAAEQMGVSEVGVQPARFSASAKPDRFLAGLTTTDGRAALVFDKPLVMHMQAFTGKPVIPTTIRGSNLNGEVAQNGFSWQRLPDGRVMVNYTPHVGISPSYDMSLASKYNGIQPLGLNLRRIIGWDHTKGGLLIPQAMTRAQGLIEYNERTRKYASGQGLSNRASAINTLFNRLNSLSPIDQLFLEHSHIASARVAKNVEFGQYLSEHVLETTQGSKAMFGLGEQIEAVLGGATYAHDASPEALRKNMKYMSSLLSMNSPENSYYTFILPKDFREEQLHEAISSIALAHHPESFGLSSMESREIYRGHADSKGLMDLRRDSFNPFSMAEKHESIESAITRMGKVQAEEAKQSNFVLPYEFRKDTNVADSEAVRVMSESTSRFFGQNQVRNPQFLTNLSNLHQRIFAQERGYFLPENERSITTNGDRLAVIEAMFPERPDLRQYAWDDSGKNNLTVFRKSDKSGYVVGYDMVTGSDSAGLPIKRRMTRTFRTEGEANAHASEVSSKSIMAELPNIMAREGTIRTKVLKDKPQAEAQVYKKLSLDAMSNWFKEGESFGVANMNATFATRAEAVAFRDILMTPEIIAGQPKPRESISLSVKGISELEQDVRSGINFGLIGSPYVFGSNLMKAINSGLVRDRSGKKEFKDAYTGKDWYDLFVTNGASKMEMRSSGVVEYLYANKDNMLSRQDLAEFTFALYPRMGRQVIHSEKQGTTIGSLTIPSSYNPKELFDKSMGPYAGHIAKVMELTKHEIPGLHPDIYKGVQDALVDAFKNAYISIYGKEALGDKFKTIEDVWGLFDRQRLNRDATNEQSFNPMVTPQIGELMRIGFNDFIAKAKLEHAAELAGMPLEMPDILTGYDDPTKRPSYAHLPSLAHAPSDTLGVGTNGLVTPLTGHNNWTEYTSGIGPYHVDIISGHFITKEMKQKATDYRNQIETKIAKLETEMPDTPERAAEIQRLRNMQDAVKRVVAIREKIASNSGNITTGHWRTPDGSIQYGHARYSFGAASLTSLPMEELQPLYGKMEKGEPMIPLVFIEEVQSDIYQKNVFGRASDGSMRLATDMKEAEQSTLYSELNDIKARMAYLTADKDETLKAVKYSNNAHLAISSVLNKVSFMRQISNMGRIERYAFLKSIIAQNGQHRLGTLKVMEDGKVMLKDGHGVHATEDTGIRIDSSKKLKISNKLADSLAIENEIPEVLMGPDGASVLADLLIAVHQRTDANIGLQIVNGHYVATHAALESMGFSVGDKIPSTGDVASFHDLIQRADSDDTQMVVSIRAMVAASVVDEGFQSSLREIATNAVLPANRTYHSFDYDALASRMLNRFKAKLNDPSTSPEKRRALRVLVGNIETAVESPAEYVPIVRHERPSIDARMSPSENPFGGGSYVDLFNDRARLDAFLKTEFIYRMPVNDHAHMRASGSTDAFKNKQRLVAMTPVRAHRIFAEQMKHMDVNLSERDKARYAQIAENLAKKYEAAARGDVGDYQSWVTAHSEFVDVMHSNAFYNRATGIVAVNDGMGELGYTPWSLSGNAVAEKSKSKTAAGKQLEHFLSPISIVLERFMPSEELDKLRLRKKEIESVLKIDPDLPETALSDSIPLGEDGMYRSLMMQFYAMRALQSKRNAIAFADARHHRSRYQGNHSVHATAFVGPNMPVIIQESHHNFPKNYVLNQSAIHSPDGFLMAMAKVGLHTMNPTRDSSGNMYVEFNGRTASVVDHAMLDVDRFFAEQFHATGAVEASLKNDIKTYLRKVMEQNPMVNGGRVTMFDYVTKHGPTGMTKESIERTYLDTYGKEEGLNMYKRVAKLHGAPLSPFVNKPFSRTNGYTANYGTAKWNNSVYYSGMPEDFINGLSNDAFQRPLVNLNEDGTYTLTDPKTNKPIATGIRQEELTERVAQNSKYLGKSPMITPFLKTFGKAGAYVMDGNLFANRNLSHVIGSDIMDALDDATRTKVAANRGNIGMQSNMTITPDIGADVFAKVPTKDSGETRFYQGLGGAPRSSATVLLGSPNGESAATPQFINIALHASGLRKGASSDEVAAAILRVGSFSSPVLVIKPKYPTTAHITEMKKILAEGIPLMSVKGIGGEQGAVNGAIQGFRFYATPTPQRRDERN